jgi:gliding motility-associated-like protein
MRYNLFILTLIFSNFVFSQIPTKCFEITSILVDGCAGSEEGQNEMVGLRIGPDAINVNDLRIDGVGASGNIAQNSWPNNPFLGFCTSPQATANLQILNNAILQCGQLLEPPGGILPAGANVIIITSTDFQPITSYFENLTETLYVVFQCAGNTQGHFVNFGSGANNLRTLVINHLPTECSDVVTYDRSLLLNANGVPGAQDGGAVAYDFDNNATYFNNGCQAPFIPAEANVIGENNITNGPSACIGGTITLTGIITGDFTSFSWSGGTGTFINPTSLITEYVLGPGDVGSVTVNLNVVSPCNPNLVSSFQFTIDEPFSSPISLSPSGIITICDLQAETISASGGSGSFTWSNGQSGSTISVSQTGIYTVTSQNACETSTINFEVEAGISPILSSTQTPISCFGVCDASATVSATGGVNYDFTWGANANNANSSTISNLCQGIYSCTVTFGACSSNIDVVILNPVSVSYTFSSTNETCSNLCDGSVQYLISGGQSPYTTTWTQNGETIPEPSSFCSGNYSLRVSDANGCIQIQDIIIGTTTMLAYNITKDTLICEGEGLNLFIQNLSLVGLPPLILWSTGETTQEILVNPVTSTTYSVSYTKDGCTINENIEVEVEKCKFDVVFPNVFTPNNDSVNDNFTPINFSGVKNINFVILNRWGNVVYESNNQDIKWDGKVNGNEASEGVYFYKIVYNEGNLSEQKTANGFLHLERK